MDLKKLLKLIESHDKIILHRHQRPDMDAIGSQLGLKYTLLENYPNKKIYAVGDQNKFDYNNEMEEIPDSYYKDSLVFITDVAVSQLVSDDRYKLAKEVVIIDHHKNESDILNAHLYVDSTYEAAAALCFDLVTQMNLKVPKKAANYFLQGIITDSGRFQYLTNASRLFDIASRLTKLGADPVSFYRWLYVEPLADRKLKNLFASRMQIDNKVCYMVNDLEFLESIGNPDFFTVSRGMVNTLSGIEELPIWANFTYDPENVGKVVMEVRSREKSVVEVCKKYGGGGHMLACGATLDNPEKIKEVIKDLNEVLESER